MTPQTPRKLVSQKELARRWSMSVRSLEAWRVKGIGPRFLKIGSNVRYDLDEIEKYEKRAVRSNTTEQSTPPGR